MCTKNLFLQDNHYPKTETPEDAVNWIFVCDTLNFCFWPLQNNLAWTVEEQSGYFGLCSALNRAITTGLQITSPNFYSNITETNARAIFESDDKKLTIPLLQERIQCLQEVGKVLKEKFDSTFVSCILSSKNSAKTLLQIIIDNFPCFRDEAVYQSQRIGVYKRAQILISDIWLNFKGKGYGDFHDIEELTMFADYRVPQVLVYFGALQYSSELYEALSSNVILQNGSQEEIEIRCASIYIVERIKSYLLDLLDKRKQNISKTLINSISIDYYLWDYRRTHAAELEYIPFHKTITKFY